MVRPIWRLSLIKTVTIVKIDRLNLEGYANLDHWVTRLDQRIEGILLQRLTSIIHIFCAEFEKTEDDIRRDVALREVSNKRRGDKKFKDDKASLAIHFGYHIGGSNLNGLLSADRRRNVDLETHSA